MLKHHPYLLIPTSVFIRGLSILFLVLIARPSLAQFSFVHSEEPVVKNGSDTLINAWAGGLENVQISDIDYDFDGDMDLFIFDRSRNNIRVFTQEIINGTPTWKIAHGAAAHFPPGLIYRTALVDYDYDGRKDIFTYGIGGLKVYRNVGNAIDGLQWELFQDIVYSDYNGFSSNLFVASSDIPAIVDVDFDGDIDVLTFHQGGQHVEYHKNMSMELYGIPDSLAFVLANECWGKFSENATNNSVTLNDPNAPCVGGDLPNPQKSSAVTRHAGSTLLAMDYDNSGVMDLILGDVAYSNLVLLINGGSAPNTDSPMISADASFPSNSLPVNMYLFPAAFWVDVDFDGKKDLIVGANAKNVSENETSVLYYKNTGTNQNPTFTYQTKAFLQNEMIERGKGSIPILYDVDHDGLKDLLVTSLYRFKAQNLKESIIAWYKNTGTASNPVYTFIDSDFLNLSQSGYGLRLVPTFGDIDNDGQDELILGRENGTLVFFESNGTTFINPQQNYTDNTGTAISVGSFSFPQLFDLDNDGLLDLIIGNKNGELYYYRNIGTATSPSFELTNSLLGNIDISGTDPDGYSAPHFFRMNDTTHLFLGALDGLVHYFNDIDGHLAPGESFQLAINSIVGLNVDGYSSCWVEDIDNDGNLNLFVGQDLGGIYHLEADPNSDVSVEKLDLPDFIIYPNPTDNIITVKTGSAETFTASLVSMDGKLIQTGQFSQELQLSLTDLNSGLYLLLLSNEKGQFMSRKIIRQ